MLIKFKKPLMSLAAIAATSIAINAHAAEANADSTAQQLEELKAQVEALASALDEKGQVAESKTTLGGYGEHHLNNLSGNDKDQIDAHRYVLFINHEYSDDLKFFSEFELEHSLAGEGKPGEVELEQAYVEKTLSSGDRLSLGMFLIPIGFLNETHEPDTFYGVERNPVESKIIPTTWWETGVMYSGDAEIFSYDLAVHSSLKSVELVDDDDDDLTPKVNQYNGIRSGRQKTAKADANEPAFTARIKGAPLKGLELAATVQYQNDLSGGADLGIDATLIAANAVYQKDKFTFKAIYAMWDINDDIEGFEVGASEQAGLTAELGYKVRNDLGVFTRYSEWDNAAADSDESSYDQIDVGVNYWLAERVVVKADYQMQTRKSDDNEVNGVNIGLGWSF
jgi:hypothetical protein